MGPLINFMQMHLLRDIYPMDDNLREAVRAISEFGTFLYARIWFQCPFICDSAFLLLDLNVKLGEYER